MCLGVDIVFLGRGLFFIFGDFFMLVFKDKGFVI